MKVRLNYVVLGTSILLAVVSLFAIILPAQAECVREGQTYQTGDVVGPYICMPDGTWKQT